MKTTAEGVERPEQMTMLRAQGCDEVQGFLFSKAVARDELSDLRHSSPKHVDLLVSNATRDSGRDGVPAKGATRKVA